MNNEPEIIGVKNVDDLQKKIYELHKEKGDVDEGHKIAIYPGVVSLEDNPIDMSSKVDKFFSSMGFSDEVIAKLPYKVLEEGFKTVDEVVELGRGKEYSLSEITHPSDYDVSLIRNLPEGVANAILVMKPTYNNKLEKFIEKDVGASIPTETYKDNVMALYVFKNK